MLTPRFSVEQDSESVTVRIYAPFTNVAETEVFMEGCDFRFFSKPYFLRLNLPGPIEENDRASAVYDADSRSFVVKAPKLVPGTHFDGLEMLSVLLRPAGGSEAVSQAAAAVEMLQAGQALEDSVESPEEIEWYFDQAVSDPDKGDEVHIQKDQAGYGFGFTHHAIYSELLEELQEVLDVKNPDSLSNEQRRELRVEQENQAFNADHYLCDKYECEEISRLTSVQSIWSRALSCNDHKAFDAFSPEEQERLIALPKKQFLVDPRASMSVYCGLVDILFAYCYDVRTTEGEHSTESGWTVGKLAASLSCCARHASLKACVVCCLRRSLCFPLYRNYELGVQTLHDVCDLLLVGRVAVVKALVECIPLMVESDGRYIFNQLYIEPYAVWVQSVSQNSLKTLSEALRKIIGKTKKDDLSLELREVEEAAELVVQEKEDEELKHLSSSLSKVAIEKGNNRQANDSDDSDDDESDSSEEDCDDSEESTSSEEQE